MNYYDAMELRVRGQHTGLWHYVVSNARATYAVGYCAEDCPGHPTPEEARAHYREYLLDTASFKLRWSRHWEPCRVCGELAERFAQVGPGGMAVYTLCDDHCNREGLDQVLPLPGVTWSS